VIHRPSGAGLTPRDLAQLQQRAGNRAVQQLVQRIPDPAAAAGGGVAGPARQDTAVKWPFKVNDHLAGSVEGTLKSFDPDAPAPSVTAGEFGQAVTKGSLEFSAALLKGAEPARRDRQKLGRNLSSRQALAAKIRKNKKLGRSLLAETAKLAKALSPALKATLSRFIPILNASFFITDTVKAIEVIYGLVSGKGYSFSMDDDAGGSGEGDDPSSGRAAEGDGVAGESGEVKEAAEAAEAAEDAEFAGLENEEAGGRPALKPAGLNPNAKEVYDALLQRSSAPARPWPAST